jgi:hypothetical protein
VLQEGIFETALETKAWVLTSALDRGGYPSSTPMISAVRHQNSWNILEFALCMCLA